MVLQLCPCHGEGAWLELHRTGAATSGTGLLLAQSGGLLFQEGLQGAGQEAGGGGLSDLLEGVEVEFEGCLVGASAPGNDFAPLGGELTQFLELVWGELAAWHVVSCLGERTTTEQ
jgi:hypothetical protein